MLLQPETQIRVHQLKVIPDPVVPPQVELPLIQDHQVRIIQDQGLSHKVQGLLQVVQDM